MVFSDAVRLSRGAPLEGRLLRLTAAAGVVLGVALSLPVRCGFVVGRSMEPTLRPWQPFLYSPSRPQGVRRGEVVLVKLAGRLCIKRVHAVGGDTFWSISAQPDALSEMIPLAPGQGVEGWKRRFPRLSYRKFRVPPGSLYVIGDSASSLDSRVLGPVADTELTGRLLRSPQCPGGNLVGCHIDDLPAAPRRRRS